MATEGRHPAWQGQGPQEGSLGLEGRPWLCVQVEQQEARLAGAGSPEKSQAAGGRATGGGRAGRGDGRMWGAENEKSRNGIAAPRKMVLLAWLQMGLSFALGELSPAPSQRTGTLETPGG